MAAVVAERTCTKCDQPRLPGVRMTWCRTHKVEYQRASAARRKQLVEV